MWQALLLALDEPAPQRGPRRDQRFGCQVSIYTFLTCVLLVTFLHGRAEAIGQWFVLLSFVAGLFRAWWWLVLRVRDGY